MILLTTVQARDDQQIDTQQGVGDRLNFNLKPDSNFRNTAFNKEVMYTPKLREAVDESMYQFFHIYYSNELTNLRRHLENSTWHLKRKKSSNNWQEQCTDTRAFTSKFDSMLSPLLVNDTQPSTLPTASRKFVGEVSSIPIWSNALALMQRRQHMTYIQFSTMLKKLRATLTGTIHLHFRCILETPRWILIIDQHTKL